MEARVPEEDLVTAVNANYSNIYRKRSQLLVVLIAKHHFVSTSGQNSKTNNTHIFLYRSDLDKKRDFMFDQ